MLPSTSPTLPMCIKRCMVDFGTANEQLHGISSVIPEGDSDARHAKDSCVHGQLRGANRKENVPVLEHLDCKEASILLFEGSCLVDGLGSPIRVGVFRVDGLGSSLHLMMGSGGILDKSTCLISEATRKSTIYLIMLLRPDCKNVRWFGTTTTKLE